ncbi:hypothetical protein ANTRET_LOCUS4183 [Anthophora retusa]
MVHEVFERWVSIEEVRKEARGFAGTQEERTADRLIERRVAADRLNDEDDGEPYESIANSRVPARRRERNGRWYGVLLPRATTTTTITTTTTTTLLYHHREQPPPPATRASSSAAAEPPPPSSPPPPLEAGAAAELP